ncbi:MAG: ATP-binding cassette domain-containing protein [Pseudonocardiaceae bacterium]|nr:ATP-binding cassette domain-containing protein [Pseudonocardiaceae bacterium]
MTPMLAVQGLAVTFRDAGRLVPALVDVDLEVAAGELVGLVGGSGAGKSTVARAVAGLVRADSGHIRFDGVDLASMSRGQLRRRRAQLHLVFQDPYASLPPSMPVGRIVAEPLVIHRIGDRQRRVADALRAAHLDPGRYSSRYPHQLSGGERQRVAFARALVTEPRLLLADEPTQMLDASLRAELADLMEELRASRGIAVLHITHDLALAQRCCDRLVVLHRGRVVEHGPTGAVLSHPEHPYTRALIDAARRLHHPAA